MKRTWAGPPTRRDCAPGSCGNVGAARWRRSPRASRDHPSSSPQTATYWQKAIAALSASFTRNCSTAPPDAGSLNFWSKALQSGSATRGGLLVSFLKTPEFAATQPLVPTENIVNMAYIGLWGRNPDSSFSSAVAGFTNTAALGNSFIKGAHYLGVGAVRNFIVGLYEGLLHRQPNAQGYRHWSSLMLSLRKTDAQVYSAFVQSPAFRAANPGRHFLPDVVTRTFQTLLGRKPTREERKGGEAYLRSGHSLASFATQFLTSEEFTANGYAQNVQHTVVVYQENWSFDGLFGLFLGVNGIADASPVSEQQVMQDGTPYQTLPPSNDANVSLASLPFNLAAYRSPSEITGDPAHAFYQEQAQINGGLMNKFVAWGYYTGSTEYNGTNDVMSYYDSRTLPLGPLAEGYTIDDDFFHSGFGGSFFNGIFLVAAAPPFFSGPIPTDLVAVLNPDGTLKQDANGAIVNDGIVTPSGYAVNDIEAAGFHDPNDPGPYLPTLNDNDPAAPHYTPTIGDLLSAAGTSWKWYSQGWNQAVADIHTQAPPGFVYDHQSLTYFANYQLGTPGQVAHIQDLSNYDMDLSQGTLPSVAFLKGLDTNDEHPGVSSELAGQLWAAQQVADLQNSSSWSNSTAIITYDENGGRWDQVAPPVEDQWGPGTRVPAIVISPFAKRGFVDNTQYETVSIDKTLEDQYHLPALSTRDAAANPMYNSYTFSPTDIVRNN